MMTVEGLRKVVSEIVDHPRMRQFEWTMDWYLL